MHLTTNALVLREVNYKESDKILTLLTEEEGKLTVSAWGCRKKGSPIAAACQLLAWGEFTLYEFNGLWSVKETASERLFDGIRSVLEKVALASYFAEVTEALAEEGQPDPGLLSVTLNCLHALDKLNLPLPQVKTAYEWRAMALAGYEPQLARCGVCGREQPRQPHIHLGEGTVHCAACRDRMGEGISLPLSAAALAKELAVSRQIIVGDVALLRANAVRAGVSEIVQRGNSLRMVIADFKPEALAAICSSPKYRQRLKLAAGDVPALTLALKKGEPVLETALTLVEDLRLASEGREMPEMVKK